MLITNSRLINMLSRFAVTSAGLTRSATNVLATQSRQLSFGKLCILSKPWFTSTFRSERHPKGNPSRCSQVLKGSARSKCGQVRRKRRVPMGDCPPGSQPRSHEPTDPREVRWPRNDHSWDCSHCRGAFLRMHRSSAWHHGTFACHCSSLYCRKRGAEEEIPRSTCRRANHCFLLRHRAGSRIWCQRSEDQVWEEGRWVHH